LEAKDGEPSTVKQPRATLLGDLAFLYPDDEIINYLKEAWVKFLRNRADADPNLHGLLMKVGVKYCTGFDEVLRMSKGDPNAQIKSQAVSALGFAPNERTQEVYDIGFVAPLQDGLWYWLGMAANPDTGRKLWDFLKANWDRIHEMFKTVSFNIPRLVHSGTAALVTFEQAQEVEEFFKANPTPIGERAIQLAVEAIKNRAVVIARDGAAVAGILESFP
jgi:hypothetical protein